MLMLLQWAAYVADIECCQILLDQGANPAAQDA